MPDITCRACGHHHLDPADATAQAGPGITAWYCRDTDACRERMRACSCPPDVDCPEWDRL